MSRLPLSQLPLKTRQVMADLPPWYSEDPIAYSIEDAMARELQRIEDFADLIRLQMFPQNADDTFGILGMWESVFSLPVKPAGVSLDQRRALVLAHYRKRSAGSGADWEDSVTEALGSTSWTYQEGPAAYTITVRFPYASGGYTTSQALVLIHEITPAHLILSIGYAQGFLVGISNVGDVL